MKIQVSKNLRSKLNNIPESIHSSGLDNLLSTIKEKFNEDERRKVSVEVVDNKVIVKELLRD